MAVSPLLPRLPAITAITAITAIPANRTTATPNPSHNLPHLPHDLLLTILTTYATRFILDPDTTRAFPSALQGPIDTARHTFAARRIQYWYRCHQFSVVESSYRAKTEEEYYTRPMLCMSTNHSLLMRQYLQSYHLPYLQAYPELLLQKCGNLTEKSRDLIRELVERKTVVWERTRSDIRGVLMVVGEEDMMLAGW